MLRRSIEKGVELSRLKVLGTSEQWIQKCNASFHFFGASFLLTDSLCSASLISLRTLSSFSRDSKIEKLRSPAVGKPSFSSTMSSSNGNRIGAATTSTGIPQHRGSGVSAAFADSQQKENRVPGMVVMKPDEREKKAASSFIKDSSSLGLSGVARSGVLCNTPFSSPLQTAGKKTIIRRTIVRKKVRSPMLSCGVEGKSASSTLSAVPPPSPARREEERTGSPAGPPRLVNKTMDRLHSGDFSSSYSSSLPSPSMAMKFCMPPHSQRRILVEEKESDEVEDVAGTADAKMEEQCGTDAARELGFEAAYLQQSVSAAADLEELEHSRGNDDEEGLSTIEEEEILEFCDEVGQHVVPPSPSSVSQVGGATVSGSARGDETGVGSPFALPSGPKAPGTTSSWSDSAEMSGRTAQNTSSPPSPLLSFEFESPLNLRLASLTRQPGKAFRAIVVHFPFQRTGSSMDFELTFEDIATGMRLVCRLSEVKSLYFSWISQFRVTFVSLFVPTLHHPSAVLLQHAILNGLPPRLPPPAGSLQPRVNDDPDHFFLSFQKLQEIVVSKHEKIREALKAKQDDPLSDAQSTVQNTGSNPNIKTQDGRIGIPLLTVTLMNTTPEEWYAFIASPLSCVPQDFFLAAYHYRVSAQTSLTATLNKELLLAQLSAAARTLLFYCQISKKGNSVVNTSASSEDFTSLSTAIAAASPARPGVISSSSSLWKLVFVSSPAKTVVVPPLMQDLLTGQFVEPLVLSGHDVLYIIGTGNSCLAFHQLPTARKGKHAVSLLLQDIESQLGLHRPHRVNLTAVLTQALENFSRRTWMGLMKLESGQLRAPQPTTTFFRFQRRSVPREIVPTFLEDVFGTGSRSGEQGRGNSSPALGDVGGGRHPVTSGTGVLSRLQLEQQPLSKDVEGYVSSIFNHPERLEREQALRDELLRCRSMFIHLETAGVTAARRSDNPFSNRNGIVEAWVQRWDNLSQGAPRPVTKHFRCRQKGLGSWRNREDENIHARSEEDKQGRKSALNPHLLPASSSFSPVFLSADDILPLDFPTKPPSDPNPSLRASNCIIIAWDAKRTLLFLRGSRRLREFLYNGGRVWCAQYAQYLLRGCDPHHLASLDRTWAMCDDPSKPPLAKPLSPVGKLRVIFDMQLQLGVHGRQLRSLTQRMDGLLASTEMETNGLRVVPQRVVSRFAQQLTQQHERLEKDLQMKIMDFTKEMEDSVRKRINFRSPQDISTIIYGGGLCRYLTSRFVPVRPSKHPITSLFPHFACHVTSTVVPHMYTQAETLLGSFHSGNASTVASSGFTFTKRQVDDALQTIQLCCRTHLPRGLNRVGPSSVLLANTAVVVLVCKASMGGMLERVSLYCPTVEESEKPHVVFCPKESLTQVDGVGEREKEDEDGKREHSKNIGDMPSKRRPFSPPFCYVGKEELRARVAVDEVTSPASPSASSSGVFKEPLLTVAQLKDKIRTFPPLQMLRKFFRAKHPLCVKAIQNVVILTDCTHERLEVLVDTGVVQTIKETILGKEGGRHNERPTAPQSGRGSYAGISGVDGGGSSLFAPPVERVCFVDLNKAIPPPPSTDDSFESDFSNLSARPPSGSFSAKESWEDLTKECIRANGGLESFFHNLLAHCASLVGTPRDPFRSSHPLPSILPQGLHGQEQASTDGMLWMATPPALHPILHRFLQGRGASSSADAIERVTVFLSPYKKNIDLSFFKCLQQLRFTEKKLQLFDEGCLFRAVLPECHDRVHGEFSHCVTATGRLSSQSPNLQNIPREEDLRRLFVSRFGTQEGRMIEADYSQLEVVVLATLSGDQRMTEEIKRKVDFHCLRVALMLKEPYESVERKVKKEKNPHYIQLRQQAKVFSFQRQYGAGVSTISTTTGLTEREVESLIAAEEQHYNGLSKFYRLVEGVVDAGSERLLRQRQLEPALPIHLRRVILLSTPKNYFVVPTGSKFDLRKDRKSGPRLKNYPVQGLAGEIVQVMCGELVRHFYKKRNYGNRAFLVNTVHDCVWVDCHKSVVELVKKDISRIMGDTQQRLAALWPNISFDVPFNAAIQSGPSLGELASD